MRDRNMSYIITQIRLFILIQILLFVFTTFLYYHNIFYCLEVFVLYAYVPGSIIATVFSLEYYLIIKKFNRKHSFLIKHTTGITLVAGMIFYITFVLMYNNIPLIPAGVFAAGMYIPIFAVTVTTKL